MGDVLEIASVILKQATDRVEINAQNIANISTAGYKRRISFADVLTTSDVQNGQASRLSVVSELSEGKPIATGNNSDLAISGSGFFAVADRDGVFYTRGGQFRRDGEGRLTTAAGLALQAQGGGDVVVTSDAFTVTADGVVLDQGQPVARLAIVDFADPAALRLGENAAFAAPQDASQDVAAPVVRQGFLEASNVSTGDEMVAMMEALRRAETGQRLVGVYDELMGRVISTFGQT